MHHRRLDKAPVRPAAVAIPVPAPTSPAVGRRLRRALSLAVRGTDLARAIDAR